MAGGDDDYCQCNLEKSERNASNHIYLCPSNNMYDKELCLNEEVQLSGFLEQLTEDLGKAELYEAMEANEKIATPDQAAIIALHADIKENMRGGSFISSCSQNIFMRDVNSIRQKIMDKASVLDIESCPLSTQELSEIIYFIRCVVSPFCMESENIISDTENGVLMFACRHALNRWCSSYGGKAPTTKQERIIFHALVVTFYLVSYIERREYHIVHNANKAKLTSELSNQYNYFVSIMCILKNRYSDILLDTKYQAEEGCNITPSLIEVDDYYENNLDELRDMVCGNGYGYGYVQRAISNSRRTFLDFIVIKDGEDTKIRTLITPGLYWLTSSTLSFEKDIKVLLSNIPESSTLLDKIISFFKIGIEISMVLGLVVWDALMDYIRGDFVDFVDFEVHE